MSIPDALLHKIKSGRCVLFLGAGASISSGGPTGEQLANYIRNEVVGDDVDFDTDLSIYLEGLFNRVARKDIEYSVKHRLEALRPSPGFSDLCSIPWKSIYTTNYDTLLEDAYSKENFYKYVKITQHNQFDSLAAHEIPLYKLHGCIRDVYDPERPLILSYSDLSVNQKVKTEHMTKLTNDLIESILFVGYSFADGVVDRILSELKESIYWSGIGQKFAVLPNPSSRDVIKFRSFGIEVVESTFDSFFQTVKTSYESDATAKLKILRRELTLNVGDRMVRFPATSKSLMDVYFDYFVEGKSYRNSPLYFYRGGHPDWGDIATDLDVPRTVKVMGNGPAAELNINDLVEEIEKHIYSVDHTAKRIKIVGPAAVGKTTVVYRLAYELIKRGTLALILRDVNDFRRGLLSEIYNLNNNLPFVVFVDNAAAFGMQLSNIVNEIQERGLAVLLVVSTRDSDWELFLDRNIKRKVNKFDLIVKLDDSLHERQIQLLVDKLLDNKVIKETVERTRNDLVSIFREKKNLLVSLMETIDDTEFDVAISSEYDSMSPLGKQTYGLISLISRYGFSFKWELLQRSLNNLYGTTWDEFITKVIQAEGKDVIKEEGSASNFYYTCRHRVIAEKIALMHYKDSSESELQALTGILRSVNRGTNEEFFIGKLISYIIDEQPSTKRFRDEQILTLLDEAIRNVQDGSFLLHAKGQFLLDSEKPEEGLKCFEKILRFKGRNRMYALHSAGMAHFNIAKDLPRDSGRRQLEFREAKDLFLQGIGEFKDNIFYYKSLLQLILVRFSDGDGSIDDFGSAKKCIEDAKLYLNDVLEDEIKELESLFDQINGLFSAREYV